MSKIREQFTVIFGSIPRVVSGILCFIFGLSFTLANPEKKLLMLRGTTFTLQKRQLKTVGAITGSRTVYVRSKKSRCLLLTDPLILHKQNTFVYFTERDPKRAIKALQLLQRRDAELIPADELTEAKPCSKTGQIHYG